MLRELHDTNVRILCRHAHHSHQLSNSYSERYAVFIDTEAGDWVPALGELVLRCERIYILLFWS